LQELAREHDGTLTSTFALMEEVADSFRRERDELFLFVAGCKTPTASEAPEFSMTGNFTMRFDRRKP
jgi:hypothetical protein